VSRRGAPHVRGAHSKFQGINKELVSGGSFFPLGQGLEG
jgi:hypothetical protein